jgi:hypothetical protein
MWKPNYHPESCPISSSITFKFPMKDGKSVKLTWMDGGITPKDQLNWALMNKWVEAMVVYH